MDVSRLRTTSSVCQCDDVWNINKWNRDLWFTSLSWQLQYTRSWCTGNRPFGPDIQKINGYMYIQMVQPLVNLRIRKKEPSYFGCWNKTVQICLIPDTTVTSKTQHFPYQLPSVYLLIKLHQTTLCYIVQKNDENLFDHQKKVAQNAVRKIVYRRAAIVIRKQLYTVTTT